MQVPRFQNIWTAGNIISLAVMLFAGVGVYVEVRTTMTSMIRDQVAALERIIKLEAAVHTSLPTQIQRSNETLTDIRISQAQQRALLDSINVRVNTITEDVQSLKRTVTGK